MEISHIIVNPMLMITSFCLGLIVGISINFIFGGWRTKRTK